MSYTPNRALQNDGVQTYTYTALNQLSGIPGKFIAYGYDALGRRERKTIGEDVYTYVWVGKQMVEEHGPDGVRKFVYGDGVDEPVCMVEPDGSIYYFHRGIGKSVIALSDESGAVVETYAYTPFGKPFVNETGGTPKSPFLFAGRWYEADAGMYYYQARHYHPELRTFLQPDPLGYEDGLNWYAYVHNNPVNYWDPDGLWTIQIGFSGAFSFWGGGFTSGMGIAISGNEHGYEFGTYSVNGAGASSGDLSGMVDITWSSNESISDLSGSSFTAGSSFSSYVSVGGEMNIPNSKAHPSYTFSI